MTVTIAVRSTPCGGTTHPWYMAILSRRDRATIAADRVPTVETQLKALTEKLDLTGDQQARITPIPQELHDGTLRIVRDKSLSREERLANVRPERDKANQQIREILSDDQKKKLDQYLRGPHPEMHGDLHG
jgi:hypothetical protein